MEELIKDTVVFLIKNKTVTTKNNNQNLCAMPKEFPLFLLEEMTNRVSLSKQDFSIVTNSSITVTRFLN